MYKKILITTDGSARSEAAVEEGAGLARKLGAEVTVLHVIPRYPIFVTSFYDMSGESVRALVEELENSGKEILQKVREKYDGQGLRLQTKLTHGDPAYEICNESKEGRYDLLIIASRGLGEIKGYLMGSVSSRVVRHAGCPVLVIK